MPVITLALGDGAATKAVHASTLQHVFSIGRFPAGTLTPDVADIAAPASELSADLVSSWDPNGVTLVHRQSTPVQVPGGSRHRMLLKGSGTEFNDGVGETTTDAVVDGVRRVAEPMDALDGLTAALAAVEDAGRWAGVLDAVLGPVVDQFGKGGVVVHAIDNDGPATLPTARTMGCAMELGCQTVLMKDKTHHGGLVIGEVARAARLAEMRALGGMMVSDVAVTAGSDVYELGVAQGSGELRAEMRLEGVWLKADVAYAENVAKIAVKTLTRGIKLWPEYADRVETILQGCLVEKDWQ